nr:vpu protein [Human immunodeficiency virus 1]UTI68674.1 vpu protein [Human immunodeficiency virus 1]UTI68683.1 vpu protein [Human immunodeficiency virus 1]UTI68692.1 vpu protein [Human immunodeficiency virus 1]UTI68701.1 vpu protein [Human immunodeficiency virus 1]
MKSLGIAAIVGLVVAFIAAIVVWTIVFIEYRKIRKQKKIDKILDRIRERAEDSGNESDGDTEELYTLMEVGYDNILDNDNL